MNLQNFFLINRRRSKFIFAVYGLIVSFAQFSQARDVQDTQGTSFIFTAPFCTASTYPVLFLIPQYSIYIAVSISTNATTNYTINPGSYLRQSIICASPKWNDISDTGMKVSSKHEISAYLEYRSDNYHIFPEDTLGLNYTVSVATTKGSYVIITASQNDTNITVSVPKGNRMRFTFKRMWYDQRKKLQLYQIHHLQVVSIKCNCDLTGILIRSSNPISVLTGSLEETRGVMKFTVEQIPKVTTWGRNFVLPLHRWSSASIVISIAANKSPCRIQVLTGTPESKSIVLRKSYGKMNIRATRFLCIVSSCSILPVYLLSSHDAQKKRHISQIAGVPYALFLQNAIFNFNTSQLHELDIIIELNRKSSLRYNGKTLSIAQASSMLTVNKIFSIVQEIKIVSSPNIWNFVEDNKASAVFYGHVFKMADDTFQIYSLGSRFASIYDACVISEENTNGNGDGLDNDCDGKIDEELLNGRDDDNDKLIDEDTKYLNLPNVNYLFMTKELPEEKGLSASIISVIISACVGVFAVLGLLASMFIADKIRGARSDRPNQVSPIEA